MPQSSLNTVRINLSRKQMEYFAQAAELGGFKSLADFFLTAASKKAEAIMQKHNAWLSSESDRKIVLQCSHEAIPSECQAKTRHETP